MNLDEYPGYVILSNYSEAWHSKTPLQGHAVFKLCLQMGTSEATPKMINNIFKNYLRSNRLNEMLLMLKESSDPNYIILSVH